MDSRCQQAARLTRLSRREILRVGAVGGLTLPAMLQMEAAGAAAREDRACIVLWLSGGPSQFDTWDPKPDAPAEVRGPFKPIPTTVPGLQLCETFPLLAQQAKHFAVLRSVHHSLDDHARGMCWMLAGRLHDAIKYPTMGSVVSRLTPQRDDMPPFVTVPRIFPIAGIPEVDHSQTAGDLGPAWDPVIPDGVPTQAGFGLRDLALPSQVNAERLTRRERLLTTANPALGLDAAGSPRRSMDAIYARAFDLLHSDRVRSAFAFEREPEKVRERYGKHPFGQTALLARRLVESGVRFVTVNWPSYYAWDHHGSVEGGIKSTAPPVDAALSALFEDLHQRGMLERTLVVCMGEFGRTPRLNKDAGRDHWVHVMSVIMGGGGLRGGQAVGSSTADGYPDERPVHARDMVATAYRALGISLDTEIRLMDGRPIRVLAEGEPVRELTG